MTQNTIDTFISRQTVSSVSAVNFINLRGYRNFRLIMNNMQRTIAGATVNTILQISTDNGSSYIATGYTGDSDHYELTNGSWSGTGSVTTGLLLTPIAVGSTGTNFSSNIEIFNANSASGYVFSQGVTIYWDLSFAYVYCPSSYYTTTNTNVNALRIVNDDGSTFSGTISIYGSV